MTATQYIAIFAAIIALSWNIISFILNNRRKIKIKGYLFIASINKYEIHLSIINIGKEPVSIKKRPIPKFKNIKSKNPLIFHDFLEFNPKDEYLIKLNKEETKDMKFDISAIFKDVENADCVFIVEAVRGREYKSNKINFSVGNPSLLIE